METVSTPRIVGVTFHIPGTGGHEEVYDRLCGNDMACWRANAAAFPQMNVRTVREIEVPQSRMRAFNRLLRLRNGKRLGLSLRSSKA